MKKLFTLFIILIAFNATHAQNSFSICGTDKMHEECMKNDANYRLRYEQTQAFLKSLPPNSYKTVSGTSGTEYHIAVVVHVMHTGGAVGTNYNPTDANIQSFIDHINDGFANTNDVSNVAGIFNSVNTPLRFYLAKRNELASCSATTGINRFDMSGNATYVANGVGSPGISDATLKNVVHWNDLDYYNIYIVNKIDGKDGYTTTGTYTAGYAYFPNLGGNEQDGMVVLAQQVGFTNSVFIHELGHAFNLKHTFEGGNQTTCPDNLNCATDNDEVCDTDPMQLVFSCNPTGPNSCTGSTWASSTVQYNYMSYNSCTDRFTPGQLTRIENVIDNIRVGYKNSAAIDAPPSSLPVFITTPTFGSTYVNNSFDMGPVLVNFNTINYTSNGYSFEGAGSVHYVDHTCNQATDLVANNTYPIQIKTKLNAQKVAVYIDYDNSGTFSTTSELVFSSTGTAGNFTHSGNITIPNIVTFNTPLRMRVIADLSSSSITPTMTLATGQAEDYTINITQFSLPVVWKSFNANLVSTGEVLLSWKTEAEKDNTYFEVEKSTDGFTFYTIDKVFPYQDNELLHAYISKDKSPNHGINYYRIKQVDVNGEATYSKTETILIDQYQFSLSSYPNPFHNQLNITLNTDNNEMIELEIVDLSGRRVYYSKQLFAKGESHIVVPTENLSSSYYILKAKSSKQTQIQKIVK
ncbi:MAG: zinc-dependent metalloprotease [Chitinophagaceae bacterium]